MIRGTYYYRWSKDDLKSKAIAAPLCLFQLTSSNTIPDVMTSPIGRRYANINDRIFTMVDSSGTVSIGYKTQFYNLRELMEPLIGQPLLILAEVGVRTNNTHVSIFALILWYAVR